MEATGQQEFDFGYRKVARPASSPTTEIVVDNFAGGGGASMGIELATGRAIDLAINHNPRAIDMHAINHPATRHLCEDVFKVDPAVACRGRPVGLAWFSPDCKHFSRAKGGKPVEKKIRGLAWVAIRWAKAVRPRVIILENVREFEDWGPLTEDNLPCQKRKGLTFRKFTGRFRTLGYIVETKVLNAADYGAPTHRRRFFLIARCDGQSIVWPAATHGPGKSKPWRTAAECIDWSIPCPSIFDRKKPLAEKTMRRIAHGIKRYVLDSAKPFIVPVTHNGERRSHGIDEPLPTVTGANRGELALVSPTITRIGQQGSNGCNSKPVDDPLTTVVTKAEHCLVAPFLVGIGGAEYAGKPKPVDEPSTTVLPNDRRNLVAAWLVKHYGGVVGTPIDCPLPTTTMRGTQNQLATANLIRMSFGEKQWNAVDDPLCTITAQSNKFALVYSFLVKYFGCGVGQVLDEPLHTVTTKDRFGVVTVSIDGQLYAIADIGMRMLAPRELARAQGFPEDYVLPAVKSHAVAAIGNSVCPPIAAALVKANYRAKTVKRLKLDLDKWHAAQQNGGITT